MQCADRYGTDCRSERNKIESSLPAWPGNYDNRARAKGETKLDRSAITSFAHVVNLYEAFTSSASMVATPAALKYHRSLLR